MTTVQEYFNQISNKNNSQILLDGDKVGKLEGNELIIENYSELEYIFIKNLSTLAKIKFKDCTKLETLEHNLGNKLEIILDNSNLANIKSDISTKRPIIINQNNNKESFCWGCFMGVVSVIGMTILIVVVFYLLRIIKELRLLVKNLKARLRLK